MAAAKATATAAAAGAPPPKSPSVPSVQQQQQLEDGSAHVVTAMLTDLYQISMAYAYWHSNTHTQFAVFDLFFRKAPFKGEFTIFAGLDRALNYIKHFRFSEADIAALRARFPEWQPGFWDYLAKIDTSEIKVYAIPEGTIVFPRVPLLRIEGPLGVGQLLETTLLNCVNFASLVCTNAARHRLAAGPQKKLLEFGLRRAQGPDGAMSASKYSYMGGFDGTSNVQASVVYGINMQGTHAHSFVTSFTALRDIKNPKLKTASGEEVDFVELVTRFREQLDGRLANEGELAAFIVYALAFPSHFLALVDTYDTLQSGVLNFLIVGLALNHCGYQPVGIRLDSGDLAYLSRMARQMFVDVSKRFHVKFEHLTIVASNDLTEEIIYSLNEQKHEIDSFGVGTNLVTCKSQPALGCVYKLVEINKVPRIKISEDVGKVTIPCRKEAYRLYNTEGQPIFDLLVTVGDVPPVPHKRILCQHPFDATKRAYVTPSRVELLHECVWDGALVKPFPTLEEVRARVSDQMQAMRSDHLRAVNPTPYKVSVSSDLYSFMQNLWLKETPIREIQ